METPLPIEINRTFESTLTKRLAEVPNFIQIVLGPRQIGKTTGMSKVFSDYKGPKLFQTADISASPNADWIDLQWKQALSLGKPCLLVIDEIQKIPNWSERIKILFDQVRASKTLRVVLLGSASLSLQTGMQESLLGRFEQIDVPHWSYQESQIAFNWNFQTYLKFGGYPAPAILIDDKTRWLQFMRNSVIEPILSRDIFNSVRINKPALFRQVLEFSMKFPAQEVSLQKILGQLQDSGNVTTIKHYLEILEGAFLIKLLEKYSTKTFVTKNSSPKFIPLAPALISTFSDPDLVDTDPEWRGRIFESAIGAWLHTKGLKLYYWREGKFEVDFVVEYNSKTYAIEVKSGRIKKPKGLEIFCRRFPEAVPVVVNFETGQNWLSGKVDFPNIN